MNDFNSKKYYWQFCDDYSGTEEAIYVVSKSFWEHNHCLDDELQSVLELDVLGFDCLAESMYGCPDGMTKKEIRELLSNHPCFKEKKMF